jgi:hypothetical protein
MEEQIYKEHIQHGVPLPDKIANAPTLFEGLGFFYNAFFELLTCRTSNNVIPYMAIEEYANINEIEGQMKTDLHFFVRQLDNTYSDYQDKKRKREQKG